MIKCPGCGAEIEFDPSLQIVKCNYCNNSYRIEELKNPELDKVQTASYDNDKYSGETYTCSQCGATLMTFDDTAITFCNYCGSQSMLKDKMVVVNNPDFVIPFSKTKDDCIKSYKNRIDSFIFAPEYLKKDSQVDRFRGIYMPYAIFHLYRNGNIAKRGEKYRNRIGDYIFYDQYTISADADISYEGVSFDLVSKFYDNFSTSIPFDYTKAVPFNINYLHGFYADSCDVKDYHYSNVAKGIVAPDISRNMLAHSCFKNYRVRDLSINLISESKTGMFPVYFLATRDKSGERVHYAAVNGQTGKVACDLPIDFFKYIIVSLFVALLIFLLINTTFVLTPIKVSIFTIIMGIVTLAFSYYQAGKINERTYHTSDIGYLSKNKIDYNDADFGAYGVESKDGTTSKTSHDYSSLKELFCIWVGISLLGLLGGISGFLMTFILSGVIMLPCVIAEFLRCNKSFYKVKKKKKHTFYIKYLYKELIGIVASIIAIQSMQANDIYYYGTTFLSLILIVLSFKDLVKEHNLLTSNELPQLGERGGNK